jgi:hypothetical protein
MLRQHHQQQQQHQTAPPGAAPAASWRLGLALWHPPQLPHLLNSFPVPEMQASTQQQGYHHYKPGQQQQQTGPPHLLPPLAACQDRPTACSQHLGQPTHLQRTHWLDLLLLYRAT